MLADTQHTNQLMQLSRDQSIQQPKKQAQQSQKIVGLVEDFISSAQKASRIFAYYQISSAQHPLWEPIACHMRSKQYLNKNTRTVPTLKSCLKFMISQYLPILMSQFHDQQKRIKIIDFLYGRVVAIRCQLYVQQILEPATMLIIIKLLIMLQILIEKPLRLVGLDQLLSPKNKKLLLTLNQQQKNIETYTELMKIGLYWANKHQFSEILTNHYEEIQNNQQLLAVVVQKRKIFSNNYDTYIRALASEKTNIYCRFILWSQIQKMREIFKARIIAANINSRMPFICKVLGYKKKEGWVNLKQQKKNGFSIFDDVKGQFDLPIKNWIPVKSIMKAFQMVLKDTNND